MGSRSQRPQDQGGAWGLGPQKRWRWGGKAGWRSPETGSDWGLREGKGLPEAGVPSAYLQPGGDSEWKVERENISARSAIFSGERPPARRGRGRASAPRPRPSSLPPQCSALPSSPRDTPCDTPPADTPRRPAGHRGSERDAAGGGEGRRIREGGDRGGDTEGSGACGEAGWRREDGLTERLWLGQDRVRGLVWGGR